ncbi:Na/Pi cotransporter family protein [Pikeienuella piscinae]|uniref:Na/Pi cotransporter family protein n=1 Tax=Pikeienuella piscinae TaxID=2748098 RepID=A0A7L5BYQ2_9RHOB|nr:Na/Pi cotransporter family protein [Pikeienuella piscinae]QIE55647.1 Na/Pi cotransporter family protein [Pikeienuella piscinae]
MVILSFIISLAGATMLLLFSVRMVRTGIERAHGASFQRVLRKQANLFGAASTGMSLAVVMQSSAAVALLAAGFLASGYLSFPTALAIILGGDLGSALIVQILSFPIGWIVAPLLAVGGWLSVKAENRRLRQYGRIIMGIALILMSLGLLREAVEPVRDSAFLPAAAAYLEADLITAFLVGAVLAFVMHSGVAAILVVITLVQIEALSFTAGFGILLGANLGSGLIPVWLARGMDIAARRLVVTNFGLRGAMALGALFLVSATPVLEFFERPNLGAAQSIIFAHIGFNVALLLLTLPFCRLIEPLAVRLLPEPKTRGDLSARIAPGSQLDKATLGTPAMALTCLKQELMRMSGLVEAMFRPSLEIYQTDDANLIGSIRAMDSQVNACLTEIRNFVAAIPRESYKKSEARAARDMVEYAIRLESAGDVISKRLTALAQRLHARGWVFRAEGRAELTQMHEGIIANIKLAANVLISNDPESARLLSLEKTDIKTAERESRKRHLKRLQNGKPESFETSDIHLETLRALREVNSHISAIAYPVLYETGQLLETRLIERMPQNSSAS